MVYDLFVVLLLVADDVSLLNLVFVKQRELTRKILFELVAEKVLHRSAVKRKNGNHISAIKLQERLEEHQRSRLISDQVDQFTDWLAEIQTLEEQQLSQTNLLETHVVNVFENILLLTYSSDYVLLLNLDIALLVFGAVKEKRVLFVQFEVAK